MSRYNIIQNFGVRETSPFLMLHYFDPILGFPPCVMHACYLGVCRTMMEAWVQSRQSDPFYVSSRQLQNIDRYLTSIKPPFRVSRKPRPLKFLAWYKAHELCMWLFYYSPPILFHVLKGEYFLHWLRLLKGLSQVLRTDTNEGNLQLAAGNLNQFWKDTYNLYGKKYCHFNFHLLTHLPYLTQHLGPMYMFLMAPFETYNMRLKSFISSSQHIGEQIAKRYLRDLLCKSIYSVNDSGEALSDYTWHSQKTGKPGWYKCPLDSCAVQYFGRVMHISGKRYYSLCNTKCKSRNSCCFSLNGEQMFEAQYFARVPCNGNTYAIGNIFNVTPAFGLWYYYEATSENHSVCNIADLEEIIIKLNYGDKIYFSKFINSVECYNE
ncbi:unnamed protein product [Allacma fusca]|uniref:Uncharacterized protein n=1 Tax=Allacma fusca TaxID=39272 RepID=A0A8J2L321_9HEXA|nr:unnamed protein product [Allacma fusca]